MSPLLQDSCPSYCGAETFVTFGPEVLHDLRSVFKSVVGLAYGIALAEGKVPPPEAKLYEQFPEYADLAKQPTANGSTGSAASAGAAKNSMPFPDSTLLSR